jgi:hypothetical protein
MSDENDTMDAPELHPEVAAFDEKIAAANSDEMSDSDKEAFNALVEERNEAFKQHHPVTPGEAPE